MVLGATVATRWFTKRRGLVVGLMTASAATGQLVFLPLQAALTENYGWRIAMALVVIVLACAMVLVLMVFVEHPADVDLPAYGDSQVEKPPCEDGRLLSTFVLPLVTLKEASGIPVFWVLFGTFFVCGLSTVGLIQTHWISICGDFGMAAVTAAGTLAIIGVLDFFGTIAAGWLSDRYDNRILLFWFYGLRGLSLVYLSFSDFNLMELSLFAIFYGLDWIATVPPTVKLAAQIFGRERAGLVFGWVLLAISLPRRRPSEQASSRATLVPTYRHFRLPVSCVCWRLSLRCCWDGPGPRYALLKRIEVPAGVAKPKKPTARLGCTQMGLLSPDAQNIERHWVSYNAKRIELCGPNNSTDGMSLLQLIFC